MTAEAKIVKAVIEHAKKRFVPHIRLVFRPGMARGWPDVQFLLHGGKPVFIEFKAPGEAPSQMQAYRINTLRELGYYVHVIDNAEHGIAIIDAYLLARRKGLEPGQVVADAERAFQA